MRDSRTNSIAQLLYAEKPTLNFAQLVGELDSTLSRYPAERRSLSWDRDDVAVFDLDGSRIVLGYSDDLEGQFAACLTVSVGQGGPVTGAGAALARRRATLCRRIVDRLSRRHAAESMLWHEIEGQIVPEVIERLVDALPRGADASPTAEPAVEIDRLMARMSAELETRLAEPKRSFTILPRRAGRSAARSPEPPRIGPSRPILLPPPLVVAGISGPAEHPELPAPQAAGATTEVANDTPDIPRLRDEDMIRVRAALYPPTPPVEAPSGSERPSTQMRLAVHAMNATMTVVFLPVGAALMTYSILRGEDMRLSGRLMALTGTALALGNSEIGLRFLSMI